MGFAHVGTNRTDQASSLTIAATPHASTAEGDIVFAFVIWRTAATCSDPEGWNLIGTHDESASNLYQKVFWRLCPAGGIGSTTWTLSVANGISVVLSSYRGGFNTSDPIDVVSNTEYITNDTAVRAASMSLSTHKTPVVLGALARTTGGTLTPPSGFTEVWDSFSVNYIIGVAWNVLTSGATGDLDYVASVARGTDGKHAFAVGLNPILTTVVSASEVSYTVVDVQFSMAVGQVTADDETKWTITKDGGGTVPSFTCTRQTDTTVVQIVFSEALAGSYTIEATAVLDTDGWLLDPANDSAGVTVLPPGGAKRSQAWIF